MRPMPPKLLAETLEAAIDHALYDAKARDDLTGEGVSPSVRVFNAVWTVVSEDRERHVEALERCRGALTAIHGEPIYGVEKPAPDEDAHGHTGQEWALLRWADLTKEVAREALEEFDPLSVEPMEVREAD